MFGVAAYCTMESTMSENLLHLCNTSRVSWFALALENFRWAGDCMFVSRELKNGHLPRRVPWFFCRRTPFAILTCHSDTFGASQKVILIMNVPNNILKASTSCSICSHHGHMQHWRTVWTPRCWTHRLILVSLATHQPCALWHCAEAQKSTAVLPFIGPGFLGWLLGSLFERSAESEASTLVGFF